MFCFVQGGWLCRAIAKDTCIFTLVTRFTCNNGNSFFNEGIEKNLEDLFQIVYTVLIVVKYKCTHTKVLCESQLYMIKVRNLMLFNPFQMFPILSNAHFFFFLSSFG